MELLDKEIIKKKTTCFLIKSTYSLLKFLTQITSIKYFNFVSTK